MTLALFFFRITLAIHRFFLWFHTNIRIVFSISVKNAIGVLIEFALNLWIALNYMATLMILILLINEHGISFHLLLPCIYFIKVYSIQSFIIFSV